MKKWSFGFCVKEWFLTSRHWDQYYEAGDHREVVTMFYADSPDLNLAKAKLLKRAEDDDMIIEILRLEFCKEVEVETHQKPIGHTQKL